MKVAAKKFTKRHRLVTVPFLFVMGSVTAPWQPAPAALVVPPSQVIVTEAEAGKQGVYVTWLKTQRGSHPVGGYIVERNHADTGFKQIIRVEETSLQYLDSEGRLGDKYRVTAEDTQRPGMRSLASEQISAANGKPGDTIVESSVAVNTSALEKASAPDAKAAVLEKLLAEEFAAFDAALSKKAIDKAQENLSTIVEYQQQFLALLPKLAPGSKNLFVASCTAHMQRFEAKTHILPEHNHFDAMAVLAHCDALTGGVE